MTMGVRLALFVVTAALLAGCHSGGSDKAGGVTAPATLSIAAQKGEVSATAFADAVHAVSKGRLRVTFIPGKFDPDKLPFDSEVRTARDVRDGRYDLGVTPARAWDELGVKSLEPLQAPLVIDDQPTFEAVLAGPLAARMLAGLKPQGVVGLGLLMGQLHHPLGYREPLIGPDDFRGKRINLPLSRTNDAIYSALGARPIHLTAPQVIRRATGKHPLDGQDASFYAPPRSWITANVSLYADATTIFVNEKTYSRLSDDQQQILAKAAAGAARRAQAYWDAKGNTERFLARHYCAAGHVALASHTDLAALRSAFGPVYAQLEQDRQVAETSAAIRRIADGIKPEPPLRLPASCTRLPVAAGAVERDPSFLNGTYRWKITRAGALKVGADPNDPVIDAVVTETLRDGRFLMQVSDGSRDSGTYKVLGNRIAFNIPDFGYTNTFTFARRRDGTLDLTPVLPMDVGDRVVTSSSPWTRVGPPVRKTP